MQQLLSRYALTEPVKIPGACGSRSEPWTSLAGMLLRGRCCGTSARICERRYAPYPGGDPGLVDALLGPLQ